MITKPVADIAGKRGSRGLRGAVSDKLQADEQATPAHITDDGKPVLKGAKPVQKPFSHDGGIVLKPLILDNRQHLGTDGAGQRGAPKGREEFHAVGKAAGDLFGGDDRAKRVAIAKRLAQNHHVRGGLLRLEPPIGVPKPPEASLHLIRDAQASGSPHPFIDSRQVPGRWLNLPADAGKALGDETGRRMPALRKQADGPVDIGGVFRARLRVIIAEAPAIGIGKLGDRHPVRRAGPARPVEFIRTDVDGAGCMAVIGVVLDDHPATAAMGACQTQRQLVRLRPRGDEIAMRQMRRQFGAKRVGEPHLQWMDIAGVGVQKPALAFDHGGDPRMCMADMRHVVIGIKVGAPMLVIQIMPPAAQNLQRAPV